MVKGKSKKDSILQIFKINFFIYELLHIHTCSTTMYVHACMHTVARYSMHITDL